MLEERASARVTIVTTMLCSVACKTTEVSRRVAANGSRGLVLVYQEVDTRLLFVVVKSYHVLVLATPEYVGTSL